MTPVRASSRKGRCYEKGEGERVSSGGEGRNDGTMSMSGRFSERSGVREWFIFITPLAPPLRNPFAVIPSPKKWHFISTSVSRSLCFPRGEGVVRVTEWLDYSPPTKANRVQSPAGSLRIFASGNRTGQCCWSVGFLGISRFPRPCIPALLHSHLLSPSSALKTSLLRAAQISPLHFPKLRQANCVHPSLCEEHCSVSHEEHGLPALAAKEEHGLPALAAKEEHGLPALAAKEEHGLPALAAKEEHGLPALAAKEEHGLPALAAKEEHGLPALAAKEEHGLPALAAKEEHGLPALAAKEEHGLPALAAKEEHGLPALAAKEEQRSSEIESKKKRPGSFVDSFGNQLEPQLDADWLKAKFCSRIGSTGFGVLFLQFSYWVEFVHGVAYQLLSNWERKSFVHVFEV
ncbi:hypothetical protein PR048_024286 [Dryococelus australis]|uniref:Uncharacterized protein n=1 Tax=Dryococelus australis TaxID=614101 RepID=A0ABQ9GN57_9NEOP|nr:hypothetical protein PR048_024286 [Dryococelus australis]